MLVSAEESSHPDMASNDESAPELYEAEADEDDDEERSPASPSSSVEALRCVCLGIGQMIELKSRKWGLD